MSTLINIPDFLVNDLNLSEISKLKKLSLLIYGKIISILLKLPSQKIIIFVLNLICEKLDFLKEGNLYKEYSQNGRYTIQYALLESSKGVDYQFNKILNDYCLKELNLKNGNILSIAVQMLVNYI